MSGLQFDEYLALLRKELVPALGCTEPAAIAYCAAKARDVLGQIPERMIVSCSGNVVKNVKSVLVPNGQGLSGINAAAVLGIVGGKTEKELQVLQDITNDQVARAKQLLEADICQWNVLETDESLHIRVWAYIADEQVMVEIRGQHTHIVAIMKNGQLIFEDNAEIGVNQQQFSMDLQSILDFADQVDLAQIKDILDQQAQLNGAIAKEGLAHDYGAAIGRTLLKYGDEKEIRTRAKALAAAGSDARMAGCSLPVVINSGSGNQGLTVSLPVLEYADALGVTWEQRYRALIIANLVAIMQKHQIGSLSAYCGAVCAAVGAASGITYLYGGDYEAIARTITNTVCNVGGMFCDGAKASCAAKIATSLEAGLLGMTMSIGEKKAFRPGDGLVQEHVEETIETIGQIGREGMRLVDSQIIQAMTKLV